MADMIYRLLLTLSLVTIHDVQKREAFETQMVFAQSHEGSHQGYRVLKSAYENLIGWGLKETPLAQELRRWVAMH